MTYSDYSLDGTILGSKVKTAEIVLCLVVGRPYPFDFITINIVTLEDGKGGEFDGVYICYVS
jgi:hypothetical protein